MKFPFFDDDSYGRLMEIGTNDCYLRSFFYKVKLKMVTTISNDYRYIHIYIYIHLRLPSLLRLKKQQHAISIIYFCSYSTLGGWIESENAGWYWYDRVILQPALPSCNCSGTHIDPSRFSEHGHFMGPALAALALCHSQDV